MTSIETTVPLQIGSRLVDFFNSHYALLRYCRTYNWISVLNDGCLRLSVSLTLPRSDRSGVWVNKTGWYRCPLDIVCSLLSTTEGVSSLIPFSETTIASGSCMSTTHGNTKTYQSYNKCTDNGKVVHVVVYSDSATLSKSGTRSSIFYSIRFSSIETQSEKWHTTNYTCVKGYARIHRTNKSGVLRFCSLIASSLSFSVRWWNNLIVVSSLTVYCCTLALQWFSPISPRSAQLSFWRTMIYTFILGYAPSFPGYPIHREDPIPRDIWLKIQVTMMFKNDQTLDNQHETWTVNLTWASTWEEM